MGSFEKFAPERIICWNHASYLQHRRCGKPNCRCARGQLHETWVLTRSEQGKHRLYMVPAAQRVRLIELTAEYRRYQRARAILVHRHQRLLQLADQISLSVADTLAVMRSTSINDRSFFSKSFLIMFIHFLFSLLNPTYPILL